MSNALRKNGHNASAKISIQVSLRNPRRLARIGVFFFSFGLFSTSFSHGSAFCCKSLCIYREYVHSVAVYWKKYLTMLGELAIF